MLMKNNRGELASFYDYVSGLPAANIDNPAEREKNAARAEQIRQDKIKNMWATIAIHDKEHAEWNKAMHDRIISDRDARFAAQRAAQERAATRVLQQPRQRDLLQEEIDGMETMVVDPMSGKVYVKDGRGNRRAYTDADRAAKREVNRQIGYDPKRGYVY